MKHFILLMILLASWLQPSISSAQISSGIVIVTPQNIPPDSIVSDASNDSVCSGESVVLSVIGGAVGEGAEWTWYEGDCNTGSIIGTGISVTIVPEATTTYFCTITGGCNEIACSEITISIKLPAQCDPLPLDLISFNAVLHQKSKGLITWETGNERNTSLFEVQQSVDGIKFTKAGVVPAVGSGNNTYRLIDDTLSTGQNFYRLKMVDLDGKFTYSPIRTIFYASSGNARLYPNPADRGVNFEIDLPKDTNIKCSILNALSQKTVVKDEVYKANAGKNVFSFDIAPLADGAYLFYYQLENGEAKIIKFIKKTD